MAESALAAADAADATRGRKGNGPLHGVPFTIKENIDCVGSPTTQGIRALADFMPTRDAAVVARMKRAGGIPLARTNLPEMGARIDTDNPLRGRTRNPWNWTLTPGGSSGGEAAALATGMTPIGIGNDIGGSLRNPAYCCGIASLKPTVGRLPLAVVNSGEYGGMSMALLTDGPMARSVADLRIGLRTMAGRDIVDPQSIDAPLEGAVPERLRAALVTRIPGCELPSATVAEIYRAGQLLADSGWQVEETQPPELDRVNEIWGAILVIDMEVGFAETKAVVKPQTAAYLARLQDHFAPMTQPNAMVHTERARLRAAVVRVSHRLHGGDRPHLDDLAVPMRRGPRPGHGHRDVLADAQVHHPGKRARHPGRRAAHGRLGRPADRDPGVCGSLSRGSLPARCRDHRARLRHADADRAGGGACDQPKSQVALRFPTASANSSRHATVSSQPMQASVMLMP